MNECSFIYRASFIWFIKLTYGNTLMKALVAKNLGSAHLLETEERSVPEVNPGYSLVRMYAATVNPLSSLVLTGRVPVARAPLVLSNDGAGIIEQSSRFSAGTKVAIYGGGQLGITEDGLQQQWVAVEDKRLIEVPADYSLEYAAALPINYITAYQAMTRVGMVKKDQVVIIAGATGSVGHALIQIANALGAVPIAVVSSTGKALHAKQAGARHVIDLSEHDLADAVREFTQDKGADLAFDPVGGEVLGQLIRALRPRGTAVSIGFVAGTEGKIDIPDLVVEEKRLLGYDAWMETDEDVEAAAEALKTLIASGHVRPNIDSIYALDDFSAAYSRLNSRNAKGTILLKLNDD